MPEQEVIEPAKRDKEEDKSPNTQAGEFVREEMHHIREGKHGAANTKQARPSRKRSRAVSRALKREPRYKMHKSS